MYLLIPMPLILMNKIDISTIPINLLIGNVLKLTGERVASVLSESSMSGGTKISGSGKSFIFI